MLASFLVEAKRKTYAANGESGEERRADGGRELTYESGQFLYRDRYYGFNPFVGQELVFKKGQCIWAMNYYGEVSPEVVDVKAVYAFLKAALREVDTRNPFRGPYNFTDEKYSYQNVCGGNVERFNGREVIKRGDFEIYKLSYQGGLVKI